MRRRTVLVSAAANTVLPSPDELREALTAVAAQSIVSISPKSEDVVMVLFADEAGAAATVSRYRGPWTLRSLEMPQSEGESNEAPAAAPVTPTRSGPATALRGRSVKCVWGKGNPPAETELRSAFHGVDGRIPVSSSAGSKRPVCLASS